MIYVDLIDFKNHENVCFSTIGLILQKFGAKRGFVWPWATSPFIAELDFTPCLCLYFLSLQCFPPKVHVIS